MPRPIGVSLLYGIAACRMRGGIDHAVGADRIPVFSRGAGSLPPTAQQAAVPANRVFASDAGIVLNFIRADKRRTLKP